MEIEIKRETTVEPNRYLCECTGACQLPATVCIEVGPWAFHLSDEHREKIWDLYVTYEEADRASYEDAKWKAKGRAYL